MQERGEKLSPNVEEQLCFEMKTILLAGHETSAAMLTWTLLELTRNPECMQKVVHLWSPSNQNGNRFATCTTFCMTISAPHARHALVICTTIMSHTFQAPLQRWNILWMS